MIHETLDAKFWTDEEAASSAKGPRLPNETV